MLWTLLPRAMASLDKLQSTSHGPVHLAQSFQKTKRFYISNKKILSNKQYNMSIWKVALN